MAKLKQVLQTRKLNSLPSDLKLIAEELIIAKFGDEAVVEKPKKEVREKSSSSFRGNDVVRIGDYQFAIDPQFARDAESYERLYEYAVKSQMGSFTRNEPSVDRRIDFHSRSSYSVTPITRADTRAFRDAIQRLDYENAPNRKRRASVSPEFARELLNHPDFRYYAGYRDDRYRGYRYGNYIGELFGVPIFAVEGVHPEIIAE